MCNIFFYPIYSCFAEDSKSPTNKPRKDCFNPLFLVEAEKKKKL